MPFKKIVFYLSLLAMFLFQLPELHSREISVDCSSDCLELERLLPEKFFVNSIDIQADYQVDKDELLYLVDIIPMSHISTKDLTQTIFYLRKKEYFSKIEVCFIQEEQKLIFKLEGLFTLASLRLHGSMIGKEKYRSCYIMEEGECFDAKKHAYSIKKLKEKFHQSGFFTCSVEDKLFFDPALKVVKVDLYLSKGPQFSIGDCKFDVESIDNIDEKELHVIKVQLSRIFLKRFYSHKYTKDVIEKSITHFKNYLNQKGYSQSSIRYEEFIDYKNRQVDIKFDFTFDEKKEFVFWGNHFFSQENFLENFLMYGKSAWHFPGAILSDEIENMYKAKGFWDIKVSVKEEKGKVFCIIHEGQRAMITHIECKDNFQMDQQLLQAKCFASIENKLFDRELFSLSIASLKQLYMQHGFWDIKVVKEELIPLPIKQGSKSVDYKIVLTLDEGPIHYLSSIEIEDYSELLQDKFFEQWSQLKESVPFNYNWIAFQKNWLLRHFKDLGHTKVIVDYEYHNQQENPKLIWKIHLDEQQVYFGKVVFTGNSQIPFKYLQRELCMHDGQVWDKKKIDTSINNLRNLELFDTVYIYSHKEIDEKGQVPVGVKLIAADTYEIRTRVGGQQVGKDFSLQQGFSYKVGGTFIYNNPFKFGDRLFAEADFTRFYGNLSVQYLMPWLFNRPIRSRIKIYDNSYLQPLYIGSDVSIYSAYQKGILFGMQEKHENLNMGMTLGVEFKGITPANIKDIAVSIDYNPELLHKQFAYGFVEPSCMWSYVDNILNPKNGWNALVSCLAMADFVNQTSLFKFLGEYALYLPLTQRTVFAIRTRIGHVFNQNYINIMPIDRFYLGGANTIRGYDRDYCPPLGLLTQPVPAPNAGLPNSANNLWRFVNQGGRTMYNLNFEIRFPVYAEIEAATFLDTGVLIKDSIQDVPDNLLAGVGFGLRYNTPIGPLRFDIAFKLDRKYPEFESAYAWYLTLGQAF